MRSLPFLTALVVLVLVSACADQPPAPAPLPAGVNVPATTPADVIALLNNAQSLQVYVPADELQSIDAQDAADGGDSGWFRKQLGWCNTNGYQQTYEGRTWQSESSMCDGVAGSLGTETAAEIALARACAAPYVVGVDSNQTCGHLGDLYEKRGEPNLALAVYEGAPKCEGDLRAEYWGPQQITGGTPSDGANVEILQCKMREMQLLGKLGRTDEERVVAQVLCNAQEETGCETVHALGGSVDMSKIEQEQMRLHAEYDAEASAVVAERKQAQAQEDESFSEKMQALRSAAGNDPNAIVDTANQAAANMIAVGAANDAARQARYRDQLEAQRREREEASATKEASQVTDTHEQNESESSGSSADRTGNAGDGLSSPNRSTAAGGGGGTNGGAYGYMARCQTSGCVPALPASCVTQFNDPKYYNWISLRDNCGQAIDLQFSRIGIGGAGQGDVAPGASVNTGFADSEAPNGLTIAVCPAAYVAWSTQTDDIWMGSGGFVCLRKP